MVNLLTDSLGLSQPVFALLRDLIHQHIGLYYDDGKRDLLANRVVPRVIERGFPSYLDYYYFLKYDPAAYSEWLLLMDVLSVPETYFWREAEAVRALVEHLVPRWVARHPNAPVRIWSAACATGEEPLSIAIALSEAGWFERAPIQIEASDGSPAAVAAARRGIYRERSFRALPASLRERYFVGTAEGWQIAPAIHRRIGWHVVNLRDGEAVSRHAAAPFIFCRNVFIYFSQASISATVREFANHMPNSGCLFLGVAESLVRVSIVFTLQEVGGAFVYVKE